MDLSEKIERMKFARETTPASAAVNSQKTRKMKFHDENYKTNKVGEDLMMPAQAAKMMPKKKL